MAVYPVIQGMLDKAQDASVPVLSAGSPDDARAIVARLRPLLGRGVPVGKCHALVTAWQDAAVALLRVTVTVRRYTGMTNGVTRYHDLVDIAGEATVTVANDLRQMCDTVAMECAA